MKDLIYENPNSLSPDLCNKIIDLFEEYKEFHFPGKCGGKHTVNLKTKITTDLEITYFSNIKRDKKWQEIVNELRRVLEENIFLYHNKLDPNNDIFHFNIIHPKITYDSFLIHKYDKNVGKFEYHNDRCVDKKKNTYRIFNYLWYLNDVEHGGETEFFKSYEIKPTQGKLVFFPSDWTFPHTGKPPISNDKYVIAGWVHCYIDK